MNTSGTASTGTAGLSRRSFISNGGAAALTVGTLALAGCSSEPAEPSDPTAGLAPGTVVLPLGELAVGTTTAVTVERVGILLHRTAESTVVAFSAVCTHQGCLIEASFRCPCHGSRFDTETGERLAGPARLPLPAIDVAIVEGNVVIA